jgi:2'-5' RNA ligase
LFFALWPDEAVRSSLDAATRQLHAQCGGRPVRRELLHQTVLFLGSVAADRVSEISGWIAGLEVPAFSLNFGATGYWKRNRIVWAAPRATPDTLRNLVETLESRARPAGFRLESRPYESHVTLIRDARAPAQFPELDFEWRVADCALVKSESSPRGVSYTVIARGTLR